MKKRTKIFTVILVVLMLLSLLLCLRPVAEKTGELIGMTADNLIYYAKTALILLVGAWLIYTGVAALAVPVVGIALIVVGVALVGYAIWPLFKTSNSKI